MTVTTLQNAIFSGKGITYTMLKRVIGETQPPAVTLNLNWGLMEIVGKILSASKVLAGTGFYSPALVLVRGYQSISLLMIIKISLSDPDLAHI